MNRAVLLTLALAAASPAAAQQHSATDIVRDCAPCHGVDGIAKERDVPHLAGQNDGYLYTQLKHFQNGRRPHKEMKVMSRAMTDAEMRAIADYFSSLPPR